MVAVVEGVKLLAPLGLRDTAGGVEGLLASRGSEVLVSSDGIERFSSEGKACSTRTCDSNTKIEACLSLKGSTGFCCTIELRLKPSQREWTFERFRRYRAVAIKIEMRTKDPMTAPTMIPAFLFLRGTAPTVGCSSLPLVGWRVGLATLLRTVRKSQKGK